MHNGAHKRPDVDTKDAEIYLLGNSGRIGTIGGPKREVLHLTAPVIVGTNFISVNQNSLPCRDAGSHATGYILAVDADFERTRLFRRSRNAVVMFLSGDMHVHDEQTETAAGVTRNRPTRNETLTGMLGTERASEAQRINEEPVVGRELDLHTDPQRDSHERKNCSHGRSRNSTAKVLELICKLNSQRRHWIHGTRLGYLSIHSGPIKGGQRCDAHHTRADEPGTADTGAEENHDGSERRGVKRDGG